MTGRDDVIAALDAALADAAASATAAQAGLDQPTIDALRAQVADDAATAAKLNDAIAALQAQLAQYQPKRKPMMIGAHVLNVAAFADAQSKLGTIPVTRVFHPGALPSSFDADAKLYPPGTVLLVSYKTPQTNVASYAASAPAGKLILSFHHEPENEYGGNGAAFVAQFVKEYDTIKAAAPGVKVPMIAMTYQYSGGRFGQSGSFLPPAEKVDAYYADNYVGAGGPDLADDPQFQGWYALVKDRGKPLGLAEYGVGNTPNDAVRAKARIATFAADTAWLQAHPDFELLLYWYSTGSGSQDWRFTDAASIAAWQQMTAVLAQH